MLTYGIIILSVFGPIVDTRDYLSGYGGNIGNPDSLSLTASLFRSSGTYFLYAFLLFIIIHGLNTHSFVFYKKTKFIIALLLSSLLIAILPIISTISLKPSLVRGGDFIMFFVFLISYFLKPVEIIWWCKKVRVGILIVYIYGSLLAIIINPNWAVMTNYETQLSVIPFRLYGMAAHPNSLSALAAIFIILGWHSKIRLKWELLHTCAALLVLSLTQAKTAWVCFIFVVIIRLARHFYFQRKLRVIYTTILIFCFISLTFLSVLNGHGLVDKILDKFSNPEVLTLTGRLPVWIMSVEAWLQRPFWGIGATFWDDDMRMVYAILNPEWSPNTAHNQLLQTLGTSGILGLTVLFVYFYIIIRFSVLYKTKTDWLSIYLIVFVILRSFTEVWIRLQGDANFILSWIVFVFVLLNLKDQQFNTVLLVGATR